MRTWTLYVLALAGCYAPAIPSGQQQCGPKGECADGYCTSVHTRRRSVYEGGGKGSRDVYDYSGKQWDPYTCNSGDQTSEAPESCGDRSCAP